MWAGPKWKNSILACARQGMLMENVGALLTKQPECRKLFCYIQKAWAQVFLTGFGAVYTFNHFVESYDLFIMLFNSSGFISSWTESVQLLGLCGKRDEFVLDVQQACQCGPARIGLSLGLGDESRVVTNIWSAMRLDVFGSSCLQCGVATNCHFRRQSCVWFQARSQGWGGIGCGRNLQNGNELLEGGNVH